MTPETIFIFAMSLTLLWIKPGPGQAFKITRALNDGFFAAFYIVLGIITACIIFFLVAVLGLEIMTKFFDKAGALFKLIGAGYLLYLAIIGFRNINKGHWQGRLDKTHKKKFVENFFPALLLTLSNPLPIFYFLGIMPTLIPIGNFMPLDILTGIMIIISVGLVVDLLLILLVSQVKEFLSDEKYVKTLNVFTSTGFLLLAVYFTYAAIFLNGFTFNLF